VTDFGYEPHLYAHVDIDGEAYTRRVLPQREMLDDVVAVSWMLWKVTPSTDNRDSENWSMIKLTMLGYNEIC